ncbi:major facilitator superfamily domain-containing protein [Coniochaeta sp. 2T2.1]|nr:major facilitator superfamily domain-containing protein [Coniochaeta sp. 2T2.1]
MDEGLDEQALRELELELNTKIYPGTEIMRDVGTHHFVKSGHGNHNVLVPQPSDDPHDPLNWSPFWKNMAIFCATALSFSLNLGPLALAPMFGAYIQEWDRSLADVVQFTGVAILCLGFSNFIWVPIMVCFGRRPVAIFATAICVGSSIWRSLATSYDSFMGACILNGLAAGPCESLMPQVIADVIFLHDRGKYQTLYFALYFISLMVGPIIAGAMNDHTGWRSFWHFNTALLVFTLVLNIFLFPETRYKREYEAPGSNHNKQSPTNQAVLTQDNNISDIKISPADQTELDRTPTTTSALKSAEAGNNLSPQLTHQDPYLGRGTPSKHQFLPWQKREGETFASILRELWLPFYLHIYPIVEFASFIVSWSAAAFLVVNLSQSQAFAAPPYNFSSQTIGLFNVAILIGAVIGLLTSGPLSDWVAARLTARNGGIREPEMRLVTMIPYVLIMILGSVITAVGYDNHWRWEIIVVVGYACVGMQVAALPSIASTYAIDSYKPVTGSMFVTITINKNLWGYGVSKFLTPWAEKSGFVPVIMMNMAMLTVFASSGIIFWFWGKKFRGMSANSFVHKL